MEQPKSSPLPLKPNKEPIKIDIINERGKKTGEYTLNDSIYRQIGLEKAFGNYVIIKFDKQVKASKMPLFVHYEDKMYRTDVLGGTKLKSKSGEGNYGGLIAVPIESGEFFKTVLTYDESFWYDSVHSSKKPIN